MKAQLLVVCLLFFISAYGQPILGKWKTIDDNTGEERSIVEIYKKENKLYGKIIKLFRKAGEDPDPVCEDCDERDPRYKKKIIGMEIITDMKESGEEYTDGEILDPESGKVYKCKIWLEGNDLKVRGYWGPFYRTQTWRRSV